MSDSKFALPLFINSKNKYVMTIISFLFVTGIYIGTNRWQLGTPVELEFSFIDHMIPHLPNTVFIYLSEYIMLVIALLLSKDHDNWSKFVYAGIGMHIFCGTIFIFWPTEFPRELFPLPEDLNPVTRAVVTYLYSVDKATSCLPSMHVSTVYLIASVFLQEQRGKFKWFFLWATSIAITTVTLKQHYFIDTIAGLGVAVLMYCIFWKWMPYRRPQNLPTPNVRASINRA